MSYESRRDHEVASSNELFQLHRANTIWLAEHGSYFVEPEDRLDVSEYDGLPISDNYPRQETTIPGDRISTVLPEAAKVLRLEDQLHLIYFLPHYQRNLGHQIEFQRPSSAFEIGDVALTLTLHVVFDEQRQIWKSDTTSDIDSEDGRPITLAEYHALADIVDSLDELMQG